MHNQNVRRVDPGGQFKTGKINSVGPSQPPPDLRDAYREFTQKLSELESAAEPKPGDKPEPKASDKPDKK